MNVDIILYIFFFIIVINVINTLFNIYKCNYAIKKQNLKHIKQLIKQTSRWLVASLQDENSLIAVLHVNYAVGYWFVLNDIYDDYEIDEAFGSIEKRKAFENKIFQSQELITKKVSAECPFFSQGLDDYLAELAGDK